MKKIILIIILSYLLVYIYTLLGRLTILIVKKISNILKCDLLGTVDCLENEPSVWIACWIIFFPFWILSLIFYLMYTSALFIENKIVSFITRS